MTTLAKEKCVVHYSHLVIEKPNLNVLTKNTHERLLLGKHARIQLGGAYHHKQQIESVPESFVEGEHYYHKQCYKNFTKAISISERKRTNSRERSSVKSSPLKRKKRSRELTSTLFPDVCMKCKSSKPITTKGKKQFLRVLQTHSACRSIEQAATLRNDDDMLLAIMGEDLIAKEFKMHPACYKEYTNICSKTKSHLASSTSFAEPDNENTSQQKADFEPVRSFIERHVISGKQSVSIKVLTELYGFDKEDSRLRSKVKQKIEKEFSDQILFLSISYHEPQIVTSRSALNETSIANFVKGSKDFILKEAASFLRTDIIKMMEEAPELPWPPTPDALSWESRQPPTSVREFITRVLHVSNHSPGEEINRYAYSFSQDLVHAVSRGNFLTEKHVLLGTGLHSMTGQKRPISILGKFGHSCSYDNVRAIETAQAELAKHLRSLNNPLPLLPASSDNKVLTFFWWDNFDVRKENNKGSFNTTHGIAYQEESPGCIEALIDKNIPRSTRRSIVFEPSPLPKRKVIPHKEPKQFEETTAVVTETNITTENAEKLIALWKLLRSALNTTSPQVARFVGFVLKVLGIENSKPTRITFLPPIRNPITEYSSVVECIITSQRLAKISNMEYVHITADAGAAMKFYQVVWNNEDEFNNVIIHLGDFHAFMEFFGIIGKLISGSGFEEAIYQAELCTSGGIKSALTGKHYNRSWLLHECFAEAIDRLFHEQFLAESAIELEARVHDYAQDPKLMLNDDCYLNHQKRYHEMRMRCILGEFGKTPRFWMTYQDAVDRQHKLHLAINTNNYDLRLQSWKESLPFCFVMNKQNYARYGAFYCRQLERLDETHPGAKAELQTKGLSVCRNSLNVGQSIDGAGEQTFMRSAKTAGGIKNFAQQDATYEKWVLNRPFQAKIADALLNLAEMDKLSSNPRKCLRDKEIRKSEDRVIKIMDVLKEDFLNPFCSELDEDKLYNLASGRPLPDEIADSLLLSYQNGENLFKEFEKRLNSSEDDVPTFFDPIKRYKWVGFSDAERKTKILSNGKTKEVAAQRDVLGLLVASSYKEKSLIDIDKMFSYPLAPVPLSLATCDGIRRKTAKSKLFDAALSTILTEDESLADAKIYVVDMIALIRSTGVIPKTFRELAQKLLRDIPNHYSFIYVACDTYKEHSIKNAERSMRGQADKFVIKTPDIRTPPDFKKFLSNGENKERLFELIEEVWANEEEILDSKTIYFARKSHCVKISRNHVANVPELETNHEEADTKVCYLIKHASQNNSEEDATCVLRSPSGDIDIPIILLANGEYSLRVLVDSGTGKHRKLLDLSACELTDDQKQALVGLHSFTGNDYVSSFLRKGKKLCWMIMAENEEFQTAFCNLGKSSYTSDETISGLQKFVCHLYGEKRAMDVDEARKNIFWKNFTKDEKITDLSLLPPCQESLQKHIKRANYVASIWRQASRPIMQLEAPANHGWTEELEVDWINEAFPADISELFVNNEDDSGSIPADEYDSSLSDEED